MRLVVVAVIGNAVDRFADQDGFAVASVEVSGSTAHGRAYRERLRGRFSALDVDECAAAAAHLRFSRGKWRIRFRLTTIAAVGIIGPGPAQRRGYRSPDLTSLFGTATPGSVVGRQRATAT